MVKLVLRLLLFVCGLWSAFAQADSKLTLTIERKIVSLGEPIVVKLVAEDIPESISKINLDKIKQNFNIYSVSSNLNTRMVKGRRISNEILTLTLYPLHTGKLYLPILSFNGFSSQSQKVSVIESYKQTPRVIFKTSMDTDHPLVRRNATLNLDVYDDGSLQWVPPNVVIATGTYQRRLAEGQHEEVIDGVRYTVHRFSWALMPLKEGLIVVEFPILDAFKFAARLRYWVKPLKLRAAPVPAYLPVYVPIGKPAVSVQELPVEIALDKPVNRLFTLQSGGISEEALHKLLADIRGNDTLRFYPTQIRNTENGRATVASQTFEICLPFVPLRTGRLQLPEIIIPYFEPETSRVESVLIPAISVEVFSPAWRTTKLIGIGLIVLMGIAGAGFSINYYWRRMNLLEKKLSVIRSASGSVELMQALLNFNMCLGNRRYLTLLQWLNHMQGVYVIGDRLEAVVMKLSDSRYGTENKNGEIEKLAEESYQCLKNLVIKHKERYGGINQFLYLTLFKTHSRDTTAVKTF